MNTMNITHKNTTSHKNTTTSHMRTQHHTQEHNKWWIWPTSHNKWTQPTDIHKKSKRSFWQQRTCNNKLRTQPTSYWWSQQIQNTTNITDEVSKQRTHERTKKMREARAWEKQEHERSKNMTEARTREKQRTWEKQEHERTYPVISETLVTAGVMLAANASTRAARK